MKIKFFGATGCVTGSKYLVSGKNDRVLVDCGLFQGFKDLRQRNWHALPGLDIGEIQAVIVTHAHLDHSGYLPVLVRNGFAGPIYCTEATAALLKILLRDAAFLQEEEASFAARHGFSKHQPPLPLFTNRDVDRVLDLIKVTAFDTPTTLSPSAHFSLRRGGHILGAASAHVACDGRSVVFSGDLGRLRDSIMPSPQIPEAADALVLESTYGDKRHAAVDPKAELAKVVNETCGGGGVLLIPAFAVGRTQMVLHYLAQLLAEKAIYRVPVFLNSPMSAAVNGVFVEFGSETKLSPAACQSASKAATVVATVEESKALNERRGPMIIIAGSGMASGGRILHHLKVFGHDPRNTILFTGHQAGGTRGAALMAGAKSVKIHGEQVAIGAQVKLLDNLSAHADSDEILEWLHDLPWRPKQVLVTHGEPTAADGLRWRVEHEMGWRCHVPYYLEEVEVHG